MNCLCILFVLSAGLDNQIWWCNVLHAHWCTGWHFEECECYKKYRVSIGSLVNACHLLLSFNGYFGLIVYLM